MNSFLWRPVLAGEWKQRELTDDTYSFFDLLDIHEMLDIKQENEKRTREYWRARQKALAAANRAASHQ